MPPATQTRLDARLAPLLGTTSEDRCYEVLALRYGTLRTTRAAYFKDGGPADDGGRSLQMDFFLWVLRNEHRTVVVDTGFSPPVGRRRQRTCLAAPIALLGALGVDPRNIDHLLLTHLHYDHIGNVEAFPHATIQVHRRELEFWRSAAATAEEFASMTEPAELAAIEAAAGAGRIKLIDGDAEVVPGVAALWTGGHTPGQLMVAVQTGGRLVVLASDALHFYEELGGSARFTLFSNAEELDAGYELLRDLVRRGAVVVPAHDPLVLERFPRLGGNLVELGVEIRCV